MPQNWPNPSLTNDKRCFNCQRLGKIVAYCPNRKVITLVEREAMKEDKVEEEKLENLVENQEKLREEAD